MLTIFFHMDVLKSIKEWEENQAHLWAVAAPHWWLDPVICASCLCAADSGGDDGDDDDGLAPSLSPEQGTDLRPSGASPGHIRSDWPLAPLSEESTRT